MTLTGIVSVSLWDRNLFGVRLSDEKVETVAIGHSQWSVMMGTEE